MKHKLSTRTTFSKRLSQENLARILLRILDLFVILEQFVCTLTVELACSKSCSRSPLVADVFLFLTVTLCIFSSSNPCTFVTVSFSFASGNRVVNSVVVVVIVVVVVSSIDDRSSIKVIVVDSMTLFVEKIVDKSFTRSSSLIDEVESIVVESITVVDYKMTCN